MLGAGIFTRCSAKCGDEVNSLVGRKGVQVLVSIMGTFLDFIQSLQHGYMQRHNAPYRGAFTIVAGLG